MPEWKAGPAPQSKRGMNPGQDNSPGNGAQKEEKHEENDNQHDITINCVFSSSGTIAETMAPGSFIVQEGPKIGEQINLIQKDFIRMNIHGLIIGNPSKELSKASIRFKNNGPKDLAISCNL